MVFFGYIMVRRGGRYSGRLWQNTAQSQTGLPMADKGYEKRKDVGKSNHNKLMLEILIGKYTSLIALWCAHQRSRRKRGKSAEALWDVVLVASALKYT